MQAILFGESYENKIVLTIGYFDAVHVGHAALFFAARGIAENLNAETAALVFRGGFKRGGDVFTYDERLLRLKTQGVKRVICAPVTEDFKNTSANDFLNELFGYYNIAGVVVGEDFTFGKDALGSVDLLRAECEKRGVEFKAVKKVRTEKGEIASSSLVKKYLSVGDVKSANSVIGSDYFITGVVQKGKQNGRKIGFPTANIKPPEDKYPIKDGVYATSVIIAGDVYGAITNVGAQPTFHGEDRVIETYIDGFSGNLYGKIITVYFIDRIRDIIAFHSVEGLKKQLERDIENVRD